MAKGKRPNRILVASDTAPDAATWRQHNYAAKLLALIERERLDLAPGIHHVDIHHDDWCAIYKGGTCDCAPDVTLSGDPALN